MEEYLQLVYNKLIKQSKEFGKSFRGSIESEMIFVTAKTRQLIFCYDGNHKEFRRIAFEILKKIDPNKLYFDLFYVIPERYAARLI